MSLSTGFIAKGEIMEARRSWFRAVSFSLVTVSLIAGASAALTGCRGQSKLIEKVNVQVYENLEAVRVSLVFTNKVKSDLAFSFALKEYGYAFLSPHTATQPFEVGFDLNTSIVNEQDYAHLQPTTVFPNGVPMGLPYALAEVRAETQLHSKFDAYAYVDVLLQSWLGTATMFRFPKQEYFPRGLTISQVFLRDAQGNPGVIASIFGPELNSNGSVKRSGGIALLANVKQLVSMHRAKMNPSQHQPPTLTLYSEPNLYLNGPAARKYEGNAKALRGIEANIIQGLNQL